MDIVNFAPTFGWQVKQLAYSPITGPEGNIEFLAHIVPQDEHIPTITPEFISRLVAQAHEGLKKE